MELSIPSFPPSLLFWLVAGGPGGSHDRYREPDQGILYGGCAAEKVQAYSGDDEGGGDEHSPSGGACPLHGDVPCPGLSVILHGTGDREV